MKKSFFSVCCLALFALIVCPACSIKKAGHEPGGQCPDRQFLQHGVHRRQRSRTGRRRPALRHQDVRVAAWLPTPATRGCACRPAACTSCTPTPSCRHRRPCSPEAEYKKQEFILPPRQESLPAGPRHHPRLPGGQVSRLPRPSCRKGYTARRWRGPMRKDAPLLYWAGAGWLGAFAIDPFDMDLGSDAARRRGH